MIFVAYELNLPLNMEKPHYRSQSAGEWSLIWAHDSRRIYRSLTYIAVPLLGPHQPRYIGLTLYMVYILTKPVICYSIVPGRHQIHNFKWINSDNLRVQNTICTENGSTTQKAIFTRITTIPENAQVAQTGDLEPVGQTKETHNYVNPAISE